MKNDYMKNWIVDIDIVNNITNLSKGFMSIVYGIENGKLFLEFKHEKLSSLNFTLHDDEIYNKSVQDSLIKANDIERKIHKIGCSKWCIFDNIIKIKDEMFVVENREIGLIERKFDSLDSAIYFIERVNL